MILVVQITGYAEPATLGGWHPEVGAASVKDNKELLFGRPESDLSVILQQRRNLLQAVS